jgi:hypothetical protein
VRDRRVQDRGARPGERATCEQPPTSQPRHGVGLCHA